MMNVSIGSDIEQLVAQMRNVRVDQLPFAISSAINTVARATQSAIPRKFESVFNRPKPFTTRAPMYVRYSTKQTLEATVGLKEIQARYLAAVLAGGDRAEKPVEQKFLGRYFVPAPAMPVDQYGNVTKTNLLALIRAVGSGSGTWRGKRVFLVDRDGGRLPPGVYAGDRARARTRTNKVQALLRFVGTAPKYRKLVDLRDEAATVVRAEFPAAFDAAYRRALASAR